MFVSTLGPGLSGHATSRVSILGDRAQPRLKIIKSKRVIRQIGLRPYISDNGVNRRGPEPKPKRNVATPSVSTVREHWKCSAILGMAAEWIEEQKAIVAVINVTARSFLLSFSMAVPTNYGASPFPCN